MAPTNTPTANQVVVVPMGGEFEAVHMVDGERIHIGWSMDRAGAERKASEYVATLNARILAQLADLAYEEAPIAI